MFKFLLVGIVALAIAGGSYIGLSSRSLEDEIENYLELSEESEIYVNLDKEELQIYSSPMADGFRTVDFKELPNELETKVRTVGVKGGSVKLQ